ncbi:hypothetical protein DOTSEDRAFT_69284 [Dothistroma septosporum NZE10]|uniref:Uncharacterized protein n=1 Tax=Dothistroma septosporum (strain NZE10 / CBS 128990) TaxID=675120 RepID=N1PYI7_DOTSN|nr:hypothetical protein DOTSEDRAFT_69284 [Dothistroma septosporum NZE10]
MASCPLLGLPRELRDMITDNVITSHQPFRINCTAQPHLVMRTQSGLDISCKTFQSEHANLLRRAAFTPGNKTVASVYNFDFRQLTTFVQGLKPREVVASNRNRNIIVDLFVLDVNELDLEGLQGWIGVCEATGCEVSYVVQWTAFNMDGIKGLESVIGTHSEGEKILRALAGRSVKCWNWEACQEGLSACR